MPMYEYSLHGFPNTIINIHHSMRFEGVGYVSYNKNQEHRFDLYDGQKQLVNDQAMISSITIDGNIMDKIINTKDLIKVDKCFNSPVGIHFKGKGFYSTDYKGK